MTKVRDIFWIVLCTGSASIVGMKMMSVNPLGSLIWIVSGVVLGVLLGWLFGMRNKRQ